MAAGRAVELFEGPFGLLAAALEVLPEFPPTVGNGLFDLLERLVDAAGELRMASSTPRRISVAKRLKSGRIATLT
jgi:hypothetical protein